MKQTALVLILILSPFLVMLLGCGSTTSAPAQTSWSVAIVDFQGNVGQYSSIAVDSNDNCHIAYFEQTGTEEINGSVIPYGNLKYATNAGNSWATQVLDTGAGMTPRIFVDKNDKVHVVHSKLGTSEVTKLLDIRYTTNKSGSWATASISAEVVKGSDASIAVDVNGHVHISLRNEEGVGTSSTGGMGGLRYVTNSTGAWTWINVDTTYSAGNDTDIAVDANGKAYISYLDKNAGLKYATNASGSWESMIIDSSYNVGWNTSIAVDKNNKIHISYSDPSPFVAETPPGNGRLKYSTNASGAWAIEIVDNQYAGTFTGLSLDNGGRVHIAYHSLDNLGASRLKYATNASGAWRTEIIEEGSGLGTYCAIAIDSSNTPHISSNDYTSQDLRYAKK